jgi:serine/threonine protein kinase
MSRPHSAPSLFPDSDADDAARALPRAFGAYTLLKALGQGGMGQVFLARRAALAGAEKLCVVKLRREPQGLRDQHEDDDESVTRFLDEARTAVRLDHRNICRVFDVSRVGDEQYLAMELVPGRDLGTLLQRAYERRVPLPPSVTLHVVCEVLDALDYAHRLTDNVTLEPLNVVHRDISPQNVMVTFDGEVKLIDFGLAQSRIKVQQTRTGIVMGKLAYMSPEQARADPVDGRCDQYAVAVMAYELFLRERFYGTLSLSEIWKIVGRGHRPTGLSRMPAELRDVLARALDPDPERRFPTCEAFREALLGYAARARSLASSSDLEQFMQQCFPGERQQDERERLDLVRSQGAVSTTAKLPELEAWQRTETMAVAAPPPAGEREESATVPVAVVRPPAAASPHPSETSEPSTAPHRRTRVWFAGGVTALLVVALALLLLRFGR